MINIQIKIIALILLTFASAPYAGQPLFSLTPLTQTTIAVPTHASGNVQYLVTNNTQITRTLTMVPIPGIVQLSSGMNTGINLCTNPFTLAPGAQCMLSLQVNGTNLSGPVQAGPVVCKTIDGSNTPDPNLCAQPAASASLNISTTGVPAIQTETIVFMRHGEKSSTPQGEIDCQGENRSIALPGVLTSMFGRPNYIFAPNPASQISGEDPSNHQITYNYLRPLATIEPTAAQLGMPINTNFSFDDDPTVAATLISQPYNNSLLFVAWEHNNILTIIQDIATLTSSNLAVPAWPGGYDPLLIVTIKTYPNNVQQASLVIGAEGLDGQSSTCVSNFPQTITPNPSLPATGAKTFLFIPEAEMATGDLGQLSCQGWNRSLALAPALNSSYGLFTALYAPDASTAANGYNYLRAIMTIQPTVVYSGSSLGQASFVPPASPPPVQPLNPLYPYTQVNTVAGAILSLPMPSVSDPSTNYAIAWQAAEMVPLVQMVYQGLGGNPSDIPTTPPDSDTMYQITLSNGGQLSFNRVHENLNGLSTLCYQP